MFANTLALTIGADSARTLTRVNQDNNGSTYKLATSLEYNEMLIRNSTAKIGGILYDVHNVEYRLTTYEVPGVSPERNYVASSTFKTRRVGGDPTRLADCQKALNVLEASTLIAGMVAGES